MTGFTERVACAWREVRCRLLIMWPWLRDRRSWGLLACAGFCLSRGALYVFPLDNSDLLPLGLDALIQWVPLAVFGVLWLATAVGTAVVAYWRIPFRPWMAVLLAMPFLWSGLYLLTGISRGGDVRSYTAWWLFLCLVVGMVVAITAPIRRTPGAVPGE